MQFIESIFLKKVVNFLIKKGKKNKSLKTVLLVLKNLKHSKIKVLRPYQIIERALNNLKPLLSIQKVRKSSKIFYLPKIISTDKKINMALR